MLSPKTIGETTTNNIQSEIDRENEIRKKQKQKTKQKQKNNNI